MYYVLEDIEELLLILSDEIMELQCQFKEKSLTDSDTFLTSMGEKI